MHGSFVPPILSHGSGFAHQMPMKPVPSVDAFREFCDQYVRNNKVSKKSPFWEPEKIRRVAMAARDGDTTTVARAYGKSNNWVLSIVKALPESLR